MRLRNQTSVFLSILSFLLCIPHDEYTSTSLMKNVSKHVGSTASRSYLPRLCNCSVADYQLPTLDIALSFEPFISQAFSFSCLSLSPLPFPISLSPALALFLSYKMKRWSFS